MSTRTLITEASVPRIARGARLHFDKQREKWVILAPERLYVLDDISHEIVKRCDGEATLAAIVDDLANSFSAERELIFSDVSKFLQDLADKKVFKL